MAYCSKCGAKLADGAKFCANCGAPVIEVEKDNSKHTDADHGIGSNGEFIDQVNTSDESFKESHQNGSSPDYNQQNPYVNSNIYHVTQPKKKKKTSIIVIAVIIVAVIVVVCAAVFSVGSDSSNSSTTTSGSNSEANSSDSVIVYEGLEINLPERWQYSPADSEKDNEYYYTSSSNKIPMLMLGRYSENTLKNYKNASNAEKKAFIESFQKSLVDRFKGTKGEIKPLEIGGYESYLFDVTNANVSGFKLDLRTLVIVNSDKSEAVAAMCGVQQGDSEGILDDVDYMSKHIKQTDKSNHLETNNIISNEKAESSSNDDNEDSSNGDAEDTEDEDDSTDIPQEYQNAVNSAQSYSDMMHMSKKGIYDQLTSEYGDQYSSDAAEYAVNHINVDWKENALAKAKDYYESMSMSKNAIYDQLISEYGEQFTEDEAQYAINNLED